MTTDSNRNESPPSGYAVILTFLIIVTTTFGVLYSLRNVAEFGVRKYNVGGASCDTLTRALTDTPQMKPKFDELTKLIYCQAFTEKIKDLRAQGLISREQMDLFVSKPRWWEDNKK